MNKVCLIVILLFCFSTIIHAQYITVWKTDNPGMTDNQSITIPATGYNYSIVWNEVGNPANTGSEIGSGIHTLRFPHPGIYEVSIFRFNGSFDGITFGGGNDCQKLLEIKNWGAGSWTSMEDAYSGCSNLTITASGIPDLQNVTSTVRMFAGCVSLTTVPSMNFWNVGQVTDMRSMFDQAANFNEAIGGWNVSNVTEMDNMFRGAASFNQFIGNWNVSNVTSMYAMFLQATSFNQPLENWNVGNVTNMATMFGLATAFDQPIGEWEVSNVTDFSYMFASAENFNQSLLRWDVSSAVNFQGMFIGAGKFNQPIGKWDVSSVENMESMFSGATDFNQSLALWNLRSIESIAAILDGTAMDCANITLTLRGWAAEADTPDNISFEVPGFTYGTGASAALTRLREEKGWIIVIGEEVDCELISPYITVWKTDNPGMSNPNQVNMPFFDSDYLVEWQEVGNPSVRGDFFASDVHLLTFPAAGVYEVSVTSAHNLPIELSFMGGGDHEKIIEIRQWGNAAWSGMDRAYSGCANLKITATDIPKTQLVTNMNFMFAGCTALTTVPGIDQWDVSNVKSMASMFSDASGFNEPIGSWDVGNVTDMSAVFAGASSFNQPIGNWDMSQVKTISGMFSNALAFNQPIGSWNVESVTDMYAAFFKATSFNQPINSWNVRNVKWMGGMFEGAVSFNQPLDNWDVGNVQTMDFMFWDASAFNGVIGTWNVANVTSMGAMFQGATSFNQPIGGWDMSRVRSIGGMFRGATSFNQPLNDWDLDEVFEMSGVFVNATSFNQPVDSWNISGVTSIDYMFFGATSFNQSLAGWDVGHITDMSLMFFGATSFNQPLGNWDVSNVTHINNIFESSGFNQSLADWELASVTDLSFIFRSSAMDCVNMTLTLQGWAANPLTASNVSFWANDRVYAGQAASALDFLRNSKNWMIEIGEQVECEALEVTLISFDARKTEGFVRLDWVTASETDNDYFEIERSNDGQTWESLSRIKGAGTTVETTHYSQIDSSPESGMNYYRLKIVDMSGRPIYSVIRNVRIEKPDSHRIYPNPADGFVTLEALSKGFVEIFNLSGVRIMQQQIKSDKEVIALDELPVGSYLLRTSDGWSSKLIKK